MSAAVVVFFHGQQAHLQRTWLPVSTGMGSCCCLWSETDAFFLSGFLLLLLLPLVLVLVLPLEPEFVCRDGCHDCCRRN